MRTRSLILMLALAGMLTPAAADAKRCRCAHGIVHTSRSCYEACGRGSRPGRVQRDAYRSKQSHDWRSDAQDARAKRARARTASGATQVRRPRRYVPKQQGLGNLEDKPPVGNLDGVFCSEGDVIVPKAPTREMILFCRKQAGR